MTMRVESGGQIDLPDLEPYLQYIVNLLFEAGPSSAGAQSAITITWVELQAWQAGIGLSMPPWLLRLLRRLSADYVAESHKAQADDAPPPWELEWSSEHRARVAGHIRKVMRG